MALHHNPRIVTSGLVFHVDAADKNSYPGTGNTWYDLSTNGYNLTLTNGPTWNAGGFFDNDSDSYFTGAGGAEIPTGNDPYTMLVWANQGGSWSSAQGLISIGGYYATSQSNALRTLGSGIGYFHHYWWGNDLSLTNNNAGIGASDWFMAAATFDGTTRGIWINGALRASDFPTGHNVTSTTIQVSKTVATEYQIGDMGKAMIYNRALTSDEMLQNYAAIKTRYS